MLHYTVRRLLDEVPITGPSDAHCLVIDAILESFRDKCAARGIVPAIDSLLNPAVIAHARSDWDTIRQEVGDLPDFNDCLAKVEALYRALPWSSDGSQGIDD
jgi:hypothetical protein